MVVRLNVSSGKPAPKAVASAPLRTLVPAWIRGEPATALKKPPQLKSAAASVAPKQGTPRIKTFVAVEVREAMAAARRELGEDAILIQTKPVAAEPGAKQKYEVTFGVVDGASAGPERSPAHSPAAKSETPVAQVPPARPAAPSYASAKDVVDLRQDIAALQAMVARYLLQPNAAADHAFPAARLRDLLVKQGIQSELATEWVTAVSERKPADANVTPRDLEEHLRGRIRIDASLGGAEGRTKCVVMVGPPGSGKTTALIKLALERGVKRGRNVEILSFDPSKAELDRKLEATATMLNLPWRAYTSAAALASAMEQPRADGALILVDTNGADLDSPALQDLARTLSAHQNTEIHLVLPAAWQPASVRRIIDRYEVFGPTRLLFTMLDQSSAMGAILQEASRTGKALSFFNHGALGGSPIEVASLDWLLNALEAGQ